LEKPETEFIKKIINPLNVIDYRLNNSFPFRLSNTEITQEAYRLAQAVNSFCEHSYNFAYSRQINRKKYLENIYLESIDNRLIHELTSGKTSFSRETKEKRLYITAAFIYNETFNTCKFYKNIIRIKLNDFEPYDFIKIAANAVSFWIDKLNFDVSFNELQDNGKISAAANDYPVIYYNPEQPIEIDSKLIEIYRITDNSVIEKIHHENIILHLKPSSVKEYSG
jgi:hypothetical protein